MSLGLLLALPAWSGGTQESDPEETAIEVSASGYKEAPMLAQRVAAGELPPIEERLPDEPFVIEPIDRVGKFGGSFQVFALDNYPWNELTEEPSRGAYILRMQQDGSIVPDLLAGYDLSEDFKTFTFYLRKGLKWSDGSPMTSADFLFKHNDMVQHPDVFTRNQVGSKADANGLIDSVTAPDDYTVVYQFTNPRPRLILDGVHWRGGEWT